MFYLKKFEQAGEVVPRVLFVGDINECFCITTESLMKYLSNRKIDWSIAPSCAAAVNVPLVKEMHEDENIVPYVWDLATCHFGRVVDKMLDLNDGIVRHVVITEANVSRIFDDFCDRVVKDTRYKDKSKEAEKKSNELVGIFLGILTQPDQFYLHPVKSLKNSLITPTVGVVKVDHKAFVTFFSHFQGDYGPQERERLVSICDRLIEDTKRRWDGAFFTPTIWVDEAHRMLDLQLGANWRDEYVVWDCCCGTLNLTRDYRFRELYCSTLISDELQLGSKYNPEAVKFQYDFLSEIGLDGLPEEAEGLKRAFAEGRKVLFLVNPPYGECGNGSANGSAKGGVAKTKVGVEMKVCGRATRQLYAQFLYKMSKLSGEVAVFSPPMFLTGPNFQIFRKLWLSKYCLSEGMLFQASEFADVGGQWGIMFSVWHHGQDERTEWHLSLKRSSDDLDNPVETFGGKTVYNLDGKMTARESVRKPKGDRKAAPVKSALNLYTGGGATKAVDTQPIDSVGYIRANCNDVHNSGQGVFLVSTPYWKGLGWHITAENFRSSVAIFSARRLTLGNWMNWQDEYSSPNETHLEYEQWNTDSIVYSLFNTKSNQSSLRDVEYKDQTWQIKNEWFWMSRQENVDLVNEHHNDSVYNDARTDEDRFVYKEFQGLTLSPDAQVVLDKAIELVRKTFEFREIANDEHPEWHIQTWDAGWYQMKKMLKAYMPAELKEFQVLYRALEDRLRDGVYEFGFLRR